jgi:hypothetical protein
MSGFNTEKVHEDLFNNDDNSPVISSLLGSKRPKYDILNENLGKYIINYCIPYEEQEIAFFFNLDNLFKLLYNDYASAKLTRGQFKRYPFAFAFELFQIIGHFRNYVFTRFGLNATILFYYSSYKCTDKLKISQEYKEKIYLKRIDSVHSEYSLLTENIKLNLELASSIIDRIPNTYLVNTLDIDPEVWPYIFIKEGNVNCTSFIASIYETDYQYLCMESEFPCNLLKLNADHTRLYTNSSLFQQILKEIKSLKDNAHNIDINLIPYIVALTGCSDLGINGIPKMGIGRAVSKVIKAKEAGIIGDGKASKESLINIDPKYKSELEISWELGNYENYYSKFITPTKMIDVQKQIKDIHEPGIIEKINSKYFVNDPIDVRMVFAGEDYY